MTIPTRYRRRNPGWGIAVVIAVPLALFGLAYSASWIPRLVGLSPSDDDLREIIAKQGQRLLTEIESFEAEYGRQPANLTEIDVLESEWRLINGQSGLVLQRGVSPDEVLEYVFSDPQSPAEPGWYRRTDSGARQVIDVPPAELHIGTP